MVGERPEQPATPQAPSDDVEVGSQARLRDVEEHAVEAKAPVAEALLRSRDPLQDEQEQLFLLEYSRHSAEFRAALEGPHLQDCRDALAAHGYACEQPSGVKAFVEPATDKIF